MLGYGAANTAFAGLALIVVARRETGILKRIRSTPHPAAVYLTALLCSIMIVFALQSGSLFVLGKLLKSTPWPTHVVSLVHTLALGGAAFAGLGLAVTGFIRSLEGSSAVVNVLVLPMAFLSGSFGPTRHYPEAARDRDVLPLKYLLDAINAIYLHGQQLWDKPTAVAVLAGWGGLGIACATAFPVGAARGLELRRSRTYDYDADRKRHRLCGRGGARRLESGSTSASSQQRRHDRGARGARQAARARGGRDLDRRRGAARPGRLGRGRPPSGPRVGTPPDRVPRDAQERKSFCERLVGLAEIWARQCINERHAELTEL